LETTSARSRSPRLRGGYKQRLGLTLASRVAKETKPATPGYSLGEVWATHVATQFLTKKSSAIQSQEAASFSSAAGAAGVDTLAKIGNRGKASRNCARDLKRVVQRGTTAPVPYMVSIPITEPKHNRVVEVEHPVLLPHEMIAYIISTGRATVKELADVVPRSDQTLAAHKHKFCVDHQVPESTCIPLGFHGDGVPFQKSTHKQSSTEVYSWNFLCDRDGKRHLFANIHKEFLCMCGCAGRCTMEALFAVFVWSVQILMGSLHPHKRHDGGPWMQPGTNLVDTHLGLMVSSFKHVGIGNGTTKCSTSLLGVQGRSVGCARPARRAGLPSPSVVPQQLGELQGTQMPNYWPCNSRRTSLPVACLVALGLALPWSALVPCTAWMLVSLQTSLATSCVRLCCGWGCLEGPRNSGSFLSGE